MPISNEVCHNDVLISMEKLITELSNESVTNISHLFNCEWNKWERLSRECSNAPADSESMAFLFERLHCVKEFEHITCDEFYNFSHDFRFICIREPKSLIYSKSKHSSTEEVVAEEHIHKIQQHSSEYRESALAVESQKILCDNCNNEEIPVLSYDLFTDHAIVILIMGNAVLSFHSGLEIKSFSLSSLTTIVSTRLHEYYPHNTQIRTVSPCWLLTLQSNNRDRLLNVLANIDQKQIDAQMQFLRYSLHIKLFDYGNKDEEGNDCESENNDLELQLLECAKRLIPLRLSVNQTLYSEGSEADYLYFIKEGSVTLSRQVEKHSRNISLHLKNSKNKLHNKAAEPKRQHCMAKKVLEPAHTDNKKLESCFIDESMQCVEVARLTSGDVCGEIALTGCDIDFRPAIDVVWTNSYWRSRLQSNIENLESTASSYNVKDATCPEINGNPISLLSNKVAETKKEKARRYVMTGTATLPTLVYALSYTDCIRFLPSLSLRRLCEYVKGYPSYDDLSTINAQQREWTAFRHNVSYSIEKVAREKAHYNAMRSPPMTF